MIDLAYERGIIFCCTAGNYVRFVAAPASAPRTIAVGGSAPNDHPWVSSSFGRAVDLCAPAWPIRRASTTNSGDFEYGPGEGTSYATPQVAGTAALWLVKHRGDLATAYPEPWIRVVAFRALVRETARVPQGGWDTSRYGTGILDAAKVLDEPLPDAGALIRDVEPH